MSVVLPFLTKHERKKDNLLKEKKYLQVRNKSIGCGGPAQNWQHYNNDVNSLKPPEKKKNPLSELLLQP